MLTREEIERFRKMSERLNILDFYESLSTRTAIYPGKGTPAGLTYVGLKMNGEAGEFAEHLGKAMRDDGFGPDATLTPERHAALVKEVGDVLWYLGAACRELGIALSEAAAINLEKLADRAERDVLQGSGDER